MSASNNPITLNAEQLENVKIIGAMLSKAHDMFKELPDEVQVQMLDFHNEGTSLNHCLRWGDQACEDLVESAEAQAKAASKKSRRP